MSEKIAFALIIFFGWSYFSLFALEAGAALLLALPHYAASPVLKNWLTPVWESTNVFLVATITGLLAFFPGATPYISTHLKGPLFLLGILLIIRASCMLVLHYADSNRKWVKWVLVGSCLLVPATLAYLTAQAVGNSLSQESPWLPPLFLSLLFLALSATLLLANSFYQYLEGQTGFILARFTRTTAIIHSLALIYFLTRLATQVDQGFVPAYSILIAFILVIMSWLIIWLLWVNRPLLAFLATLVLGGILVAWLGRSQFPYLFYSNVTVYETFTDRGAFHAMFYSFCIGMILVIPGLWMLYKVGISPEITPPSRNKKSTLENPE